MTTCRTGLGARLLGYHSIVAQNLPPTTKVMLTCFSSNATAMKFYSKHGFATDSISLTPITLRGKICPPDYLILSKNVRTPDASEGQGSRRIRRRKADQL